MYDLANVTSSALTFGIGFVVPTVVTAQWQSFYRDSIVPNLVVLIALTALSSIKPIPLSMQFGFSVSASCLIVDCAEQNVLKEFGRYENYNELKRKIASCMLAGIACGAFAWIVARILGATFPISLGACVFVSQKITPALMSYVTQQADNNYAAEHQLTQVLT